MRAAFIGTGRLLVACAESWLAEGQTIQGLVSDCPKVIAWAEAQGVARISPAQDQAAWLGREPFDHLFSIVNHTITPPQVRATPRGRAINYHDSPLPRYAGFNATSWAILDGQTEHAVTWHQMVEAVDNGPILIQQRFPIAADDTAYSLGAKCVDAGLESFRRLIAILRAEAQSGDPARTTSQGPTERFHRRSERPGPGIIDLSRPAATVTALVRALDLGTDDNWMARPKLVLPSAIVLAGQAVEVGSGQAPVGAVVAIGPDSIDIAVADGVVRFSAFSDLDGEGLLPDALGLAVGDVLPLAPAELSAEAAEADARLGRHERFWVERLAAQRVPVLTDLQPHNGAPDPAIEIRPLPAALRGGDHQRASALVAALAAHLARAGEGGDLSLQKSPPSAIAALYAPAAPMRLAVDPTESFAALCARATREFEQQDRRGSYARDVVVRYAALRAAPPALLPIAVRRGRIAGLGLDDALVPGSHLTLIVDEAGEAFAWAYDRAAITGVAARAFADRVDALLDAGLADPDRPLSALDLLPDLERDRLLATGRGEQVPGADEACVHELFAVQAARTPHARAATFRGQSLTYRELDQRANRVAEALRERGVGPDALVAVCLERSLELIVTLMGVLKAGGAYVPLDPAYPRERLAMMLEDAQPKALVTQATLAGQLPPAAADVLLIEDLAGMTATAPETGVKPQNLAYVIFTSGSTGRPKGVMVQHGNVANFFAGMDATLGNEPGVWLALTSVSFDISVLELFWTLTRGFEVVIQPESDGASLARRAAAKSSAAPMDFGLFYFAADQGGAKPGEAYRLLLEGAKFADENDFSAVWTPERHFHAFGGLYPNPAVTTAALATITKRVALRAGSIVLPLHNPLRVAEDWSVIDQLSGGRVGLSFASGWHADDFAFMPQNYERRREVMLENIDTVLKLWRGEAVETVNGQGKPISVSVLPRPLQAAPPLWIASAGSVETFKAAGRLGANVLTNMLGQDLADLKAKFAAYREARQAAGHEGPGVVTVMLHTFVCDDTEKARDLARKPFCDYLASSFDLIKVAPQMFPAFRQPSLGAGEDAAFDPAAFTDEDMAALMEHAFDRYFDTAGLFGAPEKALSVVEDLKAIGANEVACLIDFGIDPEVVIENLPHLDRLRRLANESVAAEAEDDSVADQIRERGVTHLQCTPSMARILADDPATLTALGCLKHLLVGGEALPADLADRLARAARGQVHNMYGPTETTIWSTTAPVRAGEAVVIGRPIANTVVRILDDEGRLAPAGAAGELFIGGAGVVRGYLGREDLTAERFVADPYDAGQRLYRTGDLARWRADGDLEFLGRLDHQVKINGHRIELGEIETALERHPGVRQAVVAARADEGPARLVAYIAPAADADRLAEWRGLWDAAYREAPAARDPRFNTAGWTDSFTGSPIPANQMCEWLGEVERTVLALKPRRLLEIGCGTGMVLYRLLPHVEHYDAIDVSSHALATIRNELTAAERARVTLRETPGHALDGVAERACDTVVINSVAQYFPSADYLADVIRQATDRTADGGCIFIGDVRSRDHLEAFHTLAVLAQAPGELPAADIARKAAARGADEGELVLSEAFFHALVRTTPRLAAVDVRLKTSRARNEMSAFRYDVVLHVGHEAPTTVSPPPAAGGVETLAAIRAALADRPPLLFVKGLRNARLSGAYAVRGALAANDGQDAEALRALLQRLSVDGVDPADCADLDPDYEAQMVWSRAGGGDRFDLLLRHRTQGPQGRVDLGAPAHDLPYARYANIPAKAAVDAESLFATLRTCLRQVLPDYMTPQAFVAVDAFPLTPNGKIDRARLPAPRAEAPKAAEPAAAFAPPSNALEETIAGVWRALLGIERVGLRDNIFDLGASSLLTAQANQRLSTLLGRKVSLVAMFRYPTVEALAAHLGAEPCAPAPAEAANDARKKSAAERRREIREAMAQ